MNAPLAALSRALQRSWWRPQPDLLARALQPLSWLYGALAERQASRLRRAAQALPVPVVVVGNLIVGGAGKTPCTLALLEALQARGWRPGVVSRGYGRQADDLRQVSRHSTADEVGDEPLLLHLRSRVPVMVGRRRDEAARALLAACPELNLILADDGLQHHRLARDLQVIVFDGRGIGNGLLTPAGPLREPWTPAPPPRSWVVYNADQPSTPWPGVCGRRQLAGAVSLADWWSGHAASSQTLAALRTQSLQTPLLAAAGIAEPARFFRQLAAAGVQVQGLPLPDHSRFDALPWPAGTPDVLVTEKDAVKLRPGSTGGTRVWVLALDFELSPAWCDDLSQTLASLRGERSAGPTAP